jgi:hypothetical protein
VAVPSRSALEIGPIGDVERPLLRAGDAERPTLRVRREDPRAGNRPDGRQHGAAGFGVPGANGRELGHGHQDIARQLEQLVELPGHGPCVRGDLVGERDPARLALMVLMEDLEPEHRQRRQGDQQNEVPAEPHPASTLSAFGPK